MPNTKPKLKKNEKLILFCNLLWTWSYEKNDWENIELFKGDSVAIWPFWNCLLVMQWFGHFAIFFAFSEYWRKQYILRPVKHKSEQNLYNILKRIG